MKYCFEVTAGKWGSFSVIARSLFEAKGIAEKYALEGCGVNISFSHHEPGLTCCITKVGIYDEPPAIRECKGVFE